MKFTTGEIGNFDVLHDFFFSFLFYFFLFFFWISEKACLDETGKNWDPAITSFWFNQTTLEKEGEHTDKSVIAHRAKTHCVPLRRAWDCVELHSMNNWSCVEHKVQHYQPFALRRMEFFLQIRNVVHLKKNCVKSMKQVLLLDWQHSSRESVFVGISFNAKECFDSRL